MPAATHSGRGSREAGNDRGDPRGDRCDRALQHRRVGWTTLHAPLVVTERWRHSYDAVGWKKDRLAVGLSKWVLAPWAIWAAVYVWGFFIQH